MNQDLDPEQFSLTPDLSPSALETTLRQLLVPGVISDEASEHRCNRLHERFKTFAATAPVPEWAPGLRLTDEIRNQYELYLPVAEIRNALDAFCRIACRYKPVCSSSAISHALSWPDALAQLRHLPLPVNPAALLHRLKSEKFRFLFLAELFIPKRFGSSFNRYPLQSAFFRKWLAAEKPRLGNSVAVLDAACGTGEGVYAAAATVLGLGFSPATSLVAGVTLEPLELAAAAHGWFPRDRVYSAAFRTEVQCLLNTGAGTMIRFSREDLCCPAENPALYDVIFCNGLLGGPLLHDRQKLAGVVGVLEKRLNPGGVLFVADRFHAGWKKKTPSTTFAELLTASGLRVIEAGEGIAAVKNG